MKISLTLLLILVLGSFKAQTTDFSYQVQYNLIDVEYTGGDTLFTLVCMLDVTADPSTVSEVEISIGTTQGTSDVRLLTIPYSQGTEVSLFNNNSKAMIQMGNFSPVQYYYQVRLKYQDGNYSSPLNTTSVPN